MAMEIQLDFLIKQYFHTQNFWETSIFSVIEYAIQIKLPINNSKLTAAKVSDITKKATRVESKYPEERISECSARHLQPSPPRGS